MLQGEFRALLGALMGALSSLRVREGDVHLIDVKCRVRSEG